MSQPEQLAADEQIVVEPRADCRGYYWLKNVLQYLMMGFLIFVWVWALPLLVAGFVVAAPFALIMLPLSLAISFALQFYYYEDTIVPKSVLRDVTAAIPWHSWFENFTPLDIGKPVKGRHRKGRIIVSHPHGMLTMGVVCGIHLVPGSETVMCVAPLLFYVPIIGWMARLLGLIPATYEMMSKSLEMGLTLIVVPGGVPEIVLMEQTNNLFIQKRWGFIKLAHEFQVPLIPAFTENETRTFDLIQLPLFRWRVWVAHMTNIPTVLPLMKGWKFTPLPKPVPLKVHIGETIYPSTTGICVANGNVSPKHKQKLKVRRQEMQATKKAYLQSLIKVSGLSVEQLE